MYKTIIRRLRDHAKVGVAGLLLASGTVSAAEPMDLPTLMKAFGWDFDSAVVRAEKVSPSLYVLFGIGGNVGVSIGEQGTLIVDDQFPQMVPKLNKAIANLGGSAVNFAVNTHWHFDHAEGNLALGPAGTWIVAQENSRDMMLGDHNINLVSLSYDQKAYPPAALPSITFSDTMQFHFNGERIDLLHFGPAHTTGDTAVYFRGTNAVHLGDVFNRGYPFIDADNGGDLDGMIAFCQAVHQALDEGAVVIPGHGEISDKAGLQHYINMLQTVRDRIGAMVVAGASLAEVAAAKPTANFDDEFGDPSGFVDRAYTSLRKRFEATKANAAAQQQPQVEATMQGAAAAANASAAAVKAATSRAE